MGQSRGSKFWKRLSLFSLVALLLFILFQLIVPPIFCHVHHNKRSLVCQNMKAYAHVLEVYKKDNGDYPTTKEGVDALINHPQKYLVKNVPDAWGANIIYNRTDKGYELLSYGADRKKGGESESEDFYFTDCEDR